jgi:hypothetical protein
MIIVKATAESEGETHPAPEEALLAEMADYHEQLVKAGVLLDASGLKPSSQGWRVRYDGDKRTVIDGPFAETKELIAGYTLIEVRSHDEALAWAQRFPAPFPGQPCCIEVRPLMGGIDLPPEDAERVIREQLAAIKRGG